MTNSDNGKLSFKFIKGRFTTGPHRISIEGLDGVGKTSILNEIMRQTNYGIVIVDRDAAGFATYDEVARHYNDPVSSWLSDMQEQARCSLTVYIESDEDIAIQRIESRGNGDHWPENYIDYEKAQDIYKDRIKEIELFGGSVYYVNNSGNNQKDIETIARFIIIQYEALRSQNNEPIRTRNRGIK